MGYTVSMVGNLHSRVFGTQTKKGTINIECRILYRHRIASELHNRNGGSSKVKENRRPNDIKKTKNKALAKRLKVQWVVSLIWSHNKET